MNTTRPQEKSKAITAESTASAEEAIQKLARTTESIVSVDELRKLLVLGRPLRMKYGVDLTAPLLHIGHAVNLWMYRTLQELGHKVVFLLGDFTTQIGDPTGRSKTRPVLSAQEIEANAEEFLRQVRMVLIDDPAVFEIRRNSEWLSRMSASDLLSLLTSVTHDRLVSRDMFRKRIADGHPIYMHEMLYPILQGYDSVMLDADLTIVGTDQLFNEMMGRFFQEQAGKPPQVIMTSVVTPGTDGKEKQSKSIGNYIGLGHSPRDKFGRVMSIPDSLIEIYYRVYTEVPLVEIDRLVVDLSNDPMALKRSLAREIVARYHGHEMAHAEDEWFVSRFSRQEAPPDAPIVVVSEPRIQVLNLVKECMPGKTNSELRRLIEQGAVSIGDERLIEARAEIEIGIETIILRVGKRQWFRVQRKVD